MIRPQPVCIFIDNVDLRGDIPFCLSHSSSLTLGRSVLLDTEAPI